MQWLNSAVDELIARRPSGEIIVSSGVTPSGTYHVGTLREVLTADALMRELRRRGRESRHIHVVDDLDVFRKVPANVPPEFSQYLGQAISDIPAPDGSKQTYADFFFSDFLKAAEALSLDMEVIRSHQKYREGFMVPAIETALEHADQIREILENVSGHKLDDHWSPVQVMEGNYLKNRQFISLDKKTQTMTYLDQFGKERTADYAKGEVKLNWRIDWPARWWLLKVDGEPFGRDHATKGGSYDTGAEIIKKVFGAEPPLPVPYHFINRVGETKKMSKSTGNIVSSSEVVQVLPPEIVRYFILHMPPDRQLFFDESTSAIKLVDDFSALLAKANKSADEQQLIELSTADLPGVVSRLPFSHLVASYQAALKDPAKTLEVIKRTEHQQVVEQDAEVIKQELAFIDSWLKKWAPEEVKFELAEQVSPADFSPAEAKYLKGLGQKVATAPADAGGEWFHKQIYELQQSSKLDQKQMFGALYRALIGKESGPRAGWFLSMLPRDWLVKRLNLEA